MADSTKDAGADQPKSEALAPSEPKPAAPKPQDESQFPRPEMQVFHGSRDEERGNVLRLSQDREKK